jgi:septum formation topological specificity factor MinE
MDKMSYKTLEGCLEYVQIELDKIEAKACDYDDEGLHIVKIDIEKVDGV